MTIQSINPRTGQAFGIVFPETTPAEIEVVIAQSRIAQKSWGSNVALRIAALNAIADGLDAQMSKLVELADQESGLGATRLTGEVARTSFQLRTFSDALASRTISLVSIDEAVAGNPPVGHPRFVKELTPIGVVAVFGASNFPFAFSVLGGDSASALAAGCSVIVKGHAGHPATSLKTFEIAQQGLKSVGASDGVLQIVFGFEAGRILVESQGVNAGAFTGSKNGGRALFNLANARKNPIPFFGELGSINPVVVLDSALGDRVTFAKNYLDSLLMGNGQFCTNPSILFIPDDPALISEIRSQITERDSQPFLTNATKTLHDENRRNLEAALACEKFEGINTNSRGFYSSPEVLITSVTKALTTSAPFEIECFGPTGIILTYSNHNELLDGIARINGALSSSIFASEQDVEVASVMESLKERSGRIAWNAWPTGVAVTKGQHHGGPYPAATNASTTSVGIDAIYRFLRPVSFQGIPSGLG